MFVFTRVSYRVSEDGISKRREKKLHLWKNFKEVIIGEWFIELRSKYGNSVQVINPTEEKDIFEKIKEDVITYCDPEIIKYDDKDNPTHLGFRGSVIYFYVHMIYFALGAISTDIVLSIAFIGVMKNLALPIVFFILKTLLGISVLVFIPLKKRISILLTKVYIIFDVIYFVVIYSLVLINEFSSNILIVFMVGILGNLFYVLAIFRYLGVSKRVKNYFVK